MIEVAFEGGQLIIRQAGQRVIAPDALQKHPAQPGTGGGEGEVAHPAVSGVRPADDVSGLFELVRDESGV